ncbi:MAG: DegT/DnrJ/EryC1/StrS family aminotransferase [Ekhidna sp.]|nr:DegT/DnrJ/EryC1/StrS family aminotransferase [Ekhidna sp.]
MSIPFVDLKAQYESIKGDIDHAIQSVISDTSFIGGDIIKTFEQRFASFVGINHCIAVANGTDAIEIALKALGIGEGDEVLVPALTWISTAGAVNNVGAEPVFVDVLKDERSIDPSLLKEKLSERTKAIIPVHLYGLPAQMDSIMAFARENNLKVIEDCAQAHGATFRNQVVGTFGDIATFSFYPGKNLGAYGDAGGIVANDGSLARTCKMLSNHGQLSKHDHQIIGRNSRMDTMQAAILSAKIPHLEKWTEGRIKVAAWYSSKLDDSLIPKTPEGSKHVFHLYVIESQERDALMQKLKEGNIGCAIHYPTPLPHLPSYSYKKHFIGDFPVAEKLCAEILSLPIFPELSEEEVDRICEVLGSDSYK